MDNKILNQLWSRKFAEYFHEDTMFMGMSRVWELHETLPFKLKVELRAESAVRGDRVHIGQAGLST